LTPCRGIGCGNVTGLFPRDFMWGAFLGARSRCLGVDLVQKHRVLEPVSEKLIDFSEKTRLQIFDFEPLLLARVIRPERKML
jgi:hypothetical protein